MKKIRSKTLLYLGITLFAVIFFPKSAALNLRGYVVAMIAPLWETIAPQPHASTVEQERLYAENQLLQNEVESWQELYRQQFDLTAQLGRLHDLVQEGHSVKELELFIKPQLEAIPARVIFRSPNSWSSSIWINVGAKDNNQLGKNVISRNSPVIIGNSVVGVIDYVGKRQSRVRLITDSAVAPSVRAVRGQPQNRRLIDSIAALQLDLAELLPENEYLQEELDSAVRELAREGRSWYLAKGELRGNSEPLWRAAGSQLQGIGFNYDFADSFGPARDLRTGEPIGADGEPISILEEEDLLVTTGMDGIFPPGLRVAKVTRVEMLREGDYYYELQAIPTAGDLNELNLVFVIPSQGFDSSDQPPISR